MVLSPPSPAASVDGHLFWEPEADFRADVAHLPSFAAPGPVNNFMHMNRSFPPSFGGQSIPTLNHEHANDTTQDGGHSLLFSLPANSIPRAQCGIPKGQTCLDKVRPSERPRTRDAPTKSSSQNYRPFTPESYSTPQHATMGAETPCFGRPSELQRTCTFPLTPPRSRRGRSEKKRKMRNGAKTLSLDKPLSELSKELPEAPIFDVVTYVHRAVSERKQEEIDQGKVKRPLNDFVLYRKAYSAVAKARHMGQKNQNNQQLVSQVCGASWKMETEDIKTKFKKLADVERAMHSQAFPMYKYAPKQQRRLSEDAPGPARSQQGFPAVGGPAMLPEAGHTPRARSSYATATVPPQLNYAWDVPAGSEVSSAAAQPMMAGQPPYWHSSPHPAFAMREGHLNYANAQASNEAYPLLGWRGVQMLDGRGLSENQSLLFNYPPLPDFGDASHAGAKSFHESPQDFVNIDPSLLQYEVDPNCSFASLSNANDEANEDGKTSMMYAAAPAVPDFHPEGAHNKYLMGKSDWRVEAFQEHDDDLYEQFLNEDDV